MFYRIKTNIVC